MSEEKKMTDEELLKAMEFCLKKEECGKDCRLFNVQGCMCIMLNQSFQLIQRLQNKNKLLNISLKNECEEHKQFVKLAKKIDEGQKAEIERLTLAVEGLKGENKVNHKENDELLGKIERLTKENSNVISMNDALYREKAELQKQVDELENRFENKACCNMSENCSMVQQAVKYTAREILTELYETKFKMIGEDYIYADNIKVFAKKYGVEVK